VAIQWRDSYNIGVDLVDKQHKELFSAVNKLLDSCAHGKGSEEVINVVDFLADYVINHFSAEENLQKRYGYPEFAEHKKMHENFIKDVENIKKEIEMHGVSPKTVITVNRKIVDWLTGHITSVDKKVGAYLKDKI
jgi:hemerythrin